MVNTNAQTGLTRVRKDTIAGFLVVLCIVLPIVNSLVTTGVPRRLLVFVGILLLVYEALGFRSMKYEQYFLYAIGAWIILGLMLNGIVYGEWVQESVYVPGNIAVALALCRGHLGRRTAGLLFYAAAAYFGIRLLTVKSVEDLYHLLTTGSANGISELMVVLCGLYYALTRVQGGKIRLLPATVSLAVSALTLGRSGMIAAGLLLGGLAVWDLVRETNDQRLVGKFLLYGAAGAVLLGVVLPRLDSLSFLFERFQTYGVVSADRNDIWSDYLKGLGGTGLLVGYGRMAQFAGFTNVHNSFILWHKALGLLAVPLYALTMLALARAVARDWLLLMIFGSLLLRSFFDETILPYRLYDFLFYYLVTTLLVTLPPGRRQVGPAVEPVAAVPS